MSKSDDAIFALGNKYGAKANRCSGCVDDRCSFGCFFPLSNPRFLREIIEGQERELEGIKKKKKEAGE